MSLVVSLPPLFSLSSLDSMVWAMNRLSNSAEYLLCWKLLDILRTNLPRLNSVTPPVSLFIFIASPGFSYVLKLV